MEKIVYLTFPASGFDGAAYRDRLLSDVGPKILAGAGVRGLTLSVNDLLQQIPRPMLLLGEGASLGAAVSLWLDSLDERGPVEAALSEDGERLEGYLVTESIPQPCSDRDWADGERSPGVTHFTWFEKAKAISDEDFFHNWFDVHTPFSFELHPLRWEYVRNAVARPLTPNAPAIRAIVGERFRELRDYTDPDRLFGSKEVLMQSAKEAGDYSDPSAMHSLPLSEYIVKSVA
ncbi:MAG: hypothetical protein GY944_09080 [bacterium]|nr:hypothetical protein [bacterium]